MASKQSIGEYGSSTIIQADYHRNGVGGWPFVVALVDHTAPNDPGNRRRFLVTAFDNEQGDGPDPERISAVDVAMVADGNVRFMENSWRGADMFRGLLKQEWEKIIADEYQ